MSDDTIIVVTGSMLRGARALIGMSQEQVASRAGITRPCLALWEQSSNSAPSASYPLLARVVETLESQGIRFRHDGVFYERAIPRQGVTIQSEAVA
jgi:transcriptional regulator with XRE-family HTH domain